MVDMEIEQGTVLQVDWSRPGLQCLKVQVGNRLEKALNYPEIAGVAHPGDRIAVNTTAVKLGLGSGGFHYVYFNYSQGSKKLNPGGHIIKLRYTPFQIKVLTFEEIWVQEKPSQALDVFTGLQGTPVLIGELHSMLPPAILTLKKINPNRRIVYIMDDSAALPIRLSDNISRLQEEGFLSATITCGHAFGGDYETVNIYTALMAAKEKCQADIILIAPGPGVVGTGTRYGCSGILQGEHVNRVARWNGTPIVMPRISFSEKRLRHNGFSHHLLTALEEISTFKAFVPVPQLSKKKLKTLFLQLKATGIHKKHKIILTPAKRFIRKELKNAGFQFETMQRGFDADPDFFISIIAASIFTENILVKRDLPGK